MKKLLAIFMCICMMTCILPVFGNAETITGEFYGSYLYGGNYCYNDDYFNIDSSIYNPSLSTMSLCLACTGFAIIDNDYETKSDNAVKILTELGCDNIEVNDAFKTEPSLDSMGVVVGNRKITCNDGDYTLVIAIPRSGFYGSEWSSNFTLGESGEAKGFSNSAKIVENYIDEYAYKYESTFETKVKLWIVGYSRGGAVANLAAAHLTDKAKIGNFSLLKENIFAYTFEAPMGGNIDVMSKAQAETYTNIHNIINDNDVVTYVAPVDWGFYRYGTDENVIPAERTAKNKALYDACEYFLYQYDTTGLIDYDKNGNKVFAYEAFQSKDIFGNETDKSLVDFYNDLCTSLALGVGSRSEYSKYAENIFRLLMSELLGESYQSTRLKNAYELFESRYTALYTGESLKDLAISCLEEAGIDTSAYEELPAESFGLLPRLISIVAYSGYLSGFSDISSLLDNTTNIISAHYPQIPIAFLRAQDINYNPDARALLDCAYYRSEVTDVAVAKTETTTTKKVLFVKTKVTTYNATIIPNSKVPVKEISYKYTLIGSFTKGNTLSRSTLPINTFYIKIVDANDNITYWYYSYGKITRLNW